MHDLSAFQRDLLHVIAGMDQPKGLAVKAELETYYEADVNHGRLSPNLDDLVERGLVEKGEVDKRTNYYELTDRGKQVIVNRHEWEQQYA